MAMRTDAHEAQNRAQARPGQRFAAHHFPTAGHFRFAQAHGSGDEQGGLRAGVAPAADDQWHEQHHCFPYPTFGKPRSHGREHLTQKRHHQPADFFTVFSSGIFKYG